MPNLTAHLEYGLSSDLDASLKRAARAMGHLERLLLVRHDDHRRAAAYWSSQMKTTTLLFMEHESATTSRSMSSRRNTSGWTRGPRETKPVVGPHHGSCSVAGCGPESHVGERIQYIRSLVAENDYLRKLLGRALVVIEASGAEPTCRVLG